MKTRGGNKVNYGSAKRQKAEIKERRADKKRGRQTDRKLIWEGAMIPSQALVQWAAYRQVVCAPPPSCMSKSGRTLAEAWQNCQRGGDMLRGALDLGVDRRLVGKALCACVRTGFPLLKADDFSRVLVEATEAWMRGEATIEQGRDAHYAAHNYYRYLYHYGNDSILDVGYAALYATAFALYDTRMDVSDVFYYMTRAHPSQRGEYAEMADIIRQHITLDDITAAALGGGSDV